MVQKNEGYLLEGIMRPGTNRVSPFTVIIYLFLLITAVIALFPVVYILLASFKTNQEIMVGGVNLIPREWQVNNYIRAWKLANFGLYTWNSVYMCFFIIIGSIITASIEGYVFSRGTTKFTKMVYTMVLASLFISIGTLSLFPQLRIIRAIGLNGTLWGVILIMVFGMNVTQVFLSTSFFNQIPKEIDDAARIDGCNFFSIFLFIIAPLTQPLVATIGLISFRAAWSNYLMPYVFTIARPENIPLVVGVVNLRPLQPKGYSQDARL